MVLRAQGCALHGAPIRARRPRRRPGRPAPGLRACAPSPSRGSRGRVGGAGRETGGVRQADRRVRPGRRRASGRAGGGGDSRGVGRAGGELGPCAHYRQPPMTSQGLQPSNTPPHPAPPPACPQVRPRGCGRRLRGAAAAWGRGRDSSSRAGCGVSQPLAHSPLCPRLRLGQPGAGSWRSALPTGVGGGPGRAARDWGWGWEKSAAKAGGWGGRREFAARDGGELWDGGFC